MRILIDGHSGPQRKRAAIVAREEPEFIETRSQLNHVSVGKGRGGSAANSHRFHQCTASKRRSSGGALPACLLAVQRVPSTISSFVAHRPCSGDLARLADACVGTGGKSAGK